MNTKFFRTKKSPTVTTSLAILITLLPLIGCGTDHGKSPLSHSIFSDMMYLQDSTSARISSWNQTGANADHKPVPAGGSLELANIKGAGCIRRIYFTGFGVPHNVKNMRNVVLRMYWDGERSPSVEVPIADFFGVGFERYRFFQSQMINVNPGVIRYGGLPGLVSYFPMPFAKGARITLTNDGDMDLPRVWFHIDYESFDRLDDNVGRFHAQWRRENPTTPVGEHINDVLYDDGINIGGQENYTILEAEGQGNLVGYFLYVDNISGGWYGEGDDMIFIDDDTWPPSFHGTGSEEIFGGGACPATEYTGPYTGYHMIANPDFAGKNAMYRFFVSDPIRFQKSIRVTIEHGHANNYETDYSSVAFWYQSEPHAPFPTLPSARDRRPRAGNDPSDQAYLAYYHYREKQVEFDRLIREQKITPTPEDVATVGGLIIPGADMVEKRQFEQAIQQCRQAIAIVDRYIAQIQEPSDPAKEE